MPIDAPFLHKDITATTVATTPYGKKMNSVAPIVLQIRKRKIEKYQYNYLEANFIFILQFLGGPYCKETIGTANNMNFTRTLIGIADSLQICVMSRGASTANGFTWNINSKECFAINDAKFINDQETLSLSCIFDGMLFFS